MLSNGKRVLNVIKEALPGAWKTSLWMVKITATVSLIIVFLRYTGVLYWFSNLLAPVFQWVGLPGEAALAYVTGYFVNVYSSIAVMVTLSLDFRAITILSVMVLCSHNIIAETAVQKKTGSSAIRMVVIRTLSAFLLGAVLNQLMPGEIMRTTAAFTAVREPIKGLLSEWFWATLQLAVKMTVLIFFLSIFQRLLSEFGVIRLIAKFLRPVMHFFGLPAKTAFLWIVANTMGLGYGAAIMIEEADRGKISKEDADLLNHHIAISHSNLEDVVLLAAVGAMIWWLLLSRWTMSLLLVWELRLERMLIRKKSS
ncbi:MAG: nucleoside recognition domain-containing protein [Bacteroidales bacterium]|nr:nucleoside recognition domain-containing protein [Bacteroidales bacterium]